MASAGIRWPPVPPPAIRTVRRFVRPLDDGDTLATCFYPRRALLRSRHRPSDHAARCLDSFARHSRSPADPPLVLPPLSRARRPGASAQPADIDEDPCAEQRDHLARSAVGHEREGEPRRRHQAERDRHVHERSEADRRRQSHREILPEGVGRGPRDAEPQPAEQGEERNDHQHSQEAPLLTDGAEEKVGVRVRQIAQLLLPFPEADPEAACPSRCPPATDGSESLPRWLRRPDSGRSAGAPADTEHRGSDGRPESFRSPASRPKWPILAPEVNSTRPPSRATSVAIERLGSSRMRTEIKPRTE